MDRFTVRLSSSHKPSGNTKPLVFKNPILTASGTFGYGVEFANYGDLTHLGGIVVKGLSLKPRPGNPLPRVAETPCGMLNAVGLQNDGVESFLKNKLPRLPWHETPVIANLYATSPAEFAELAGILAAEEDVETLIVSQDIPGNMAPEQVEQFSDVARAAVAVRAASGKPSTPFITPHTRIPIPRQREITASALLRRSARSNSNWGYCRTATPPVYVPYELNLISIEIQQ